MTRDEFARILEGHIDDWQDIASSEEGRSFEYHAGGVAALERVLEEVRDEVGERKKRSLMDAVTSGNLHRIAELLNGGMR